MSYLYSILTLSWLAWALLAWKPSLISRHETPKKDPSDYILTAIPVTFYLRELTEAVPDASQYLYYEIKICTQGRAVRNQALLNIALPDNPAWTNLNTVGYIMAQVSVCQRDFSQKCIIAQNYVYDIQPQAKPALVWNIGNETYYYIRVTAGTLVTPFAMELSFVTDMKPFTYNYTSTSNIPFNGDTVPVSKPAVFLEQYWKTEVMYSVKNNELAYFAFAYCDQPNLSILGIETVVAAPNTRPFSLMDQYGCPTTIQPFYACTPTAATLYGWSNLFVASFNTLPCPSSSSRNTANGIYIVVEGYGGEPDAYNNFTIRATTIIPL